MRRSNQQPMLTIQQPGLLATVQDRGRFGYAAQGVSRGGAVDERALLWANKLLGNHANAAAIEVTLGGFKALVHTAGFAVVCGAPVTVRLNGVIQPTWQVFTVAAGDQLEIAPAARGLRSYLAVAGGFDVALTMGSVATVMRDGLGGLHGDGTPLQANDTLYVGQQQIYPPVINRRPKHELIPRISAQSILQLGMVPLAQFDEFAQQEQQRLLEQTYTVTARQDRMGVRLSGEQPLSWTKAQIISQPLPVGTIQIPPDGQPIIMLNDAQTLGGYPKIGVLTWSARMALAQATANTQIRFVKVTMAEAQAELRCAEVFFGATS